MRLRVIDFETTGGQAEDEVIEAAYVDVVYKPFDLDTPAGMSAANNLEADGAWHGYPSGCRMFVKSDRPVQVEARAAHHITDEEISGGVSWSLAKNYLRGSLCLQEKDHPTLGHTPDYYVAHNCAFEQQFFNPEGSQWICTLKAACRLWEDAPRHKNQVLRYWLNDCDPGEAGQPPHRALPDCRVTALILCACLRVAPLELLVEWTREPLWKPVIGFGKHRGKRWTEVPKDYIRWVLRQDFDEDTKWNAKKGLES